MSTLLEVGSVVGHLDKIDLREIILLSCFGKLRRESREKILSWYETSIKSNSDFILILTYPDKEKESQ